MWSGATSWPALLTGKRGNNSSALKETQPTAKGSSPKKKKTQTTSAISTNFDPTHVPALVTMRPPVTGPWERYDDLDAHMLPKEVPREESCLK